VEKTLIFLQNRLLECPTRDRAALARRLQGLRRRWRDGKPFNHGLEQLTVDLDAATARLSERRATLPIPTFDDSLPINAHREAIATAIRDHPVVVVCGETGSGKTTQLPKICLSLGLV
jgi:ATP-dependent helicase HrpA